MGRVCSLSVCWLDSARPHLTLELDTRIDRPYIFYSQCIVQTECRLKTYSEPMKLRLVHIRTQLCMKTLYKRYNPRQSYTTHRAGIAPKTSRVGQKLSYIRINTVSTEQYTWVNKVPCRVIHIVVLWPSRVPRKSLHISHILQGSERITKWTPNLKCTYVLYSD